jgi:DNA-binding CsgD family transcriptional regulator
MPHDRDRIRSDHALGLDGPLIGAFEEMPVPMWVADRLGYVRWLNRAAVTLLGTTVGSHFSRYFAAEDVADARELFAQRAEGRRDSGSRRATLRTVLGPVTVELASVAIRDGEEVVGVIALIREELPASSARRRPKPRLTPRQQEVLELLADGRSTADIAQVLAISEDTVRNHIRYLFAELRVRTRLEAVVTAFRNDWL